MYLYMSFNSNFINIKILRVLPNSDVFCNANMNDSPMS